MKLMFSLRFSNMLMNGMLNGTKDISTNLIMSAPNGASDGSGRYMNSPFNEDEYVHVWCYVRTY